MVEWISNRYYVFTTSERHTFWLKKNLWKEKKRLEVSYLGGSVPKVLFCSGVMVELEGQISNG